MQQETLCWLILKSYKVIQCNAIGRGKRTWRAILLELPQGPIFRRGGRRMQTYGSDRSSKQGCKFQPLLCFKSPGTSFRSDYCSPASLQQVKRIIPRCEKRSKIINRAQCAVKGSKLQGLPSKRQSCYCSLTSIPTIATEPKVQADCE